MNSPLSKIFITFPEAVSPVRMVRLFGDIVTRQKKENKKEMTLSAKGELNANIHQLISPTQTVVIIKC